METVGEERVRVATSLRHLEEAALLLEQAARPEAPEKISPGFPTRVADLVHQLTSISSREDAERLLATGQISSIYSIPSCTSKCLTTFSISLPCLRRFYVECYHCF